VVSLIGAGQFFATIPALVALETLRPQDSPHFLVWFMLLVAVNHWMATRIKEKRDFQLAHLPVSIGQIGFARLLLVVLTTVAFAGLYALIHLTLGPADKSNPKIIISLVAVAITVFSLVLMFRDRYLNTTALRRGKITIVVVLSATILLGLYAALTVDKAGTNQTEPPFLIQVIDYIFQHNPFAHYTGVLLSLAVSLILAYLAALSFRRRRTHIE
jgi:hypothetical protein